MSNSGQFRCGIEEPVRQEEVARAIRRRPLDGHPVGLGQPTSAYYSLDPAPARFCSSHACAPLRHGKKG